MSDFLDMVHDPAHRRRFERLLYLAAKRGDADLVAERLGWGIDPNCTFGRGTTPLMANVRGPCPSAATVQALLKHGADAGLRNEAGLTALDYARRKLSRLRARPEKQPAKSPSLDENDQLQLSPAEQAELDKMRAKLGSEARDYLHLWWQERLRVARRVFNDVNQVERVVGLLEAAER